MKGALILAMLAAAIPAAHADPVAEAQGLEWIRKNTETGFDKRIDIVGEAKKAMADKCLAAWRGRLLDPARAYFVDSRQQLVGRMNDETKKIDVRRVVILDARSPNPVGGMAIVKLACEYTLGGELDAALTARYQQSPAAYRAQMLQPTERP